GRPAADLVGVDHAAVRTGQGTVHPQGFGHPGAAWREVADVRLVDGHRPWADACADRIELRPHAGTGLFRTHATTAHLRERELSHCDDPHRGRRPAVPGQIRRAR